MNRLHASLTFALLLFVSARSFAQDEIDFNRDIRPILSDHCFHCHGPDEETREADLRFDVRDGAVDYLEPGDADASHLIELVVNGEMPPAEINKPLDAKKIALLKQWVNEGAKWSEFWAYEPPTWHEVPLSSLPDSSLPDSSLPESSLPNSSLPEDAHWIDRLVASRLQSQGVDFNAPADKRTLLRRLYFDLTGLPPTLEQVESFVSDSATDAYERQVDDLLASPHFGERMAIYWLDLVRYADTVGYHGDQPHNISPYRDWVIQAFNQNMPFDQFTKEQLAGDLIEGATIEQKVASGYNRLLQTSHEGGVQAKEYNAIYAADRVRNVSLVWMGATVGCAQCHDHKYDPYTSRDFYSLAAFFADVDDEAHFRNGTNALPTRRDPELLLLSEEDQADLDSASAELDKARESLKLKQGALKSLSSEASDSDLVAEIASAEKVIEELKDSVAVIQRRGRYTMVTKRLEQPRTMRVLPRGNWLDESGEIVEPAVPAFLGKIEGVERASRLDLAHWLTDADQKSGQLTARVMANRLWYLMMGVGVSPSLDDFGGQGVPPVFPELLDNLALDFSQDWDIKRLLRQIVLTHTYQQSSIPSQELMQLDPENALFARQSRHRLPAEMIRDNALAVSGLLVSDEVGGESIKPYQPDKYYRHLNFPTRTYKHDKDESQWRRGVYVHWQRQFLHPTLKALDAPSREECTAARPKSNTPLAALALMNDPSFVEAARVFAARILLESNETDIASMARWAIEHALTRSASDSEVKLIVLLVKQERDYFAEHPDDAEELLSVGMAKVSGVARQDPAELAAWTMAARALFNSSEFVTRN